jgi:hypothetical protein
MKKLYEFVVSALVRGLPLRDSGLPLLLTAQCHAIGSGSCAAIGDAVPLFSSY